MMLMVLNFEKNKVGDDDAVVVINNNAAAITVLALWALTMTILLT